MFRPLGDRILVKRFENSKETPGGIYIPDSIQEKPMEGVVIAVGPGSWKKGERTKIHVKEGDRVVFGKWAGDDVEIDGEEYVIMTEENLIGVLR